MTYTDPSLIRVPILRVTSQRGVPDADVTCHSRISGLSVESTTSSSAITLAAIPAGSIWMQAAVLAAVAIGVACNLVNGFLVATLKTPAFIVTLGMMLIARGAVLELTQGQNVLQLGDFILIGQGNLGWLPIPVLILIATTIVVWYLMNQTRYGRAVYAVGGNEEAARAAGIAVDRIKYKAFLVNGVLVGIAGVIFMSRVNAGLPNAGIGYELQAITAPIIGGTSFSGGIGTVIGSIIGGLVMAFLNNGLALLGQGADVVSMIKGIVLLFAVGIDVWNKQQGRPSIIGFMTRRSGRNTDPEASPVFEPNKTYQAPPVDKTRSE